MVDRQDPPDGWRLDAASETYDGIVDRSFTTLVYRDDADDETVRVRNVQKPNGFGGWGYLAWTTDPMADKLGLFRSIDDAVERAFEYMRTTARASTSAGAETGTREAGG